MSRIGLWKVSGDQPVKLSTGGSYWEHQLESWIEEDPDLLEAGITIVGRQVRVEGGILDLLAIDTQGTWVVIELKRNTLYRETVAQALDYASSISSMPHDRLMGVVKEYLGDESSDLRSFLTLIDDDDETRDVRVCLVGTSADAGLTRLSTYLATIHDVPITVVTFRVYELEQGQHVLLRELTDAEANPQQQAAHTSRSIESVCARADSAGTGAAFRSILKTAEERGLYPRPYKVSVMYTPPANRNRMLFTVWIRPHDPGKLAVYFGCEAFSEFYPIEKSEVETLIGANGWWMFSASETPGFLDRLNRLMDAIEAKQH